MQEHVEAVRRFNRFYTGRIGVVRRDYLDLPYTLGEARLLYELGHAGERGGETSATGLGRALGLDPGYLSRLLQGLRRRGLVKASPAAGDARRTLLALSDKGRQACAQLNERSRSRTAEMLAPLDAPRRQKLVDALATVQGLLGEERALAAPRVTLRAHRPGDMGWVTQRHGMLYHQEYGWDERFEALVAGIVADFIRNLDPARERCWIAELNGQPVGSVFVVKGTKSEAKLRLLLVEPRARGLGLGKRLVQECIGFARSSGYRRLVLWTQSNLAAARGIYRAAGFRRLRTEKHRDFGVPLSGEYWALEL